MIEQGLVEELEAVQKDVAFAAQSCSIRRFSSLEPWMQGAQVQAIIELHLKPEAGDGAVGGTIAGRGRAVSKTGEGHRVCIAAVFPLGYQV